MKRGKGFWPPVIASLIATPICLVLGLGSAGVGHGDYILATFLFPYTILLMSVTGATLPPFIVIILAIAQFPAYGIILGNAAVKQRFRWWAVLLLVIHALATIICFVLRGSFST